MDVSWPSNLRLLEPRIGRAIPNLTFEMGSLWPHEWWNRYTRNLYVWVRYSKLGTVSRTRIENLTVVSVFIASLPLTYWNKYNIFSLILRKVDVSRIFLCNFYKNLPHSRCFFIFDRTSVLWIISLFSFSSFSLSSVLSKINDHNVSLKRQITKKSR